MKTRTQRILAAAAALLLCIALPMSAAAAEASPAAVIGSHELSAAELNYFFVDYINYFLSNYGSYLQYFGLDPTVPLNEQETNSGNGQTWADLLLSSALQNAQMIYAMGDAAREAGYALSESEQQKAEEITATLEAYAAAYGFEDADAFLRMQYGETADMESFAAYYAENTLANTYRTYYMENLPLTREALDELDARDPAAHSQYAFHVYTLSVSAFLEDPENASEEETAAAAEAAEAAARSLTEGVTTAEELDAAIAALEVNQDAAAASEAVRLAGSNVSSYVKEWVTDSDRRAGDITSIPVYHPETQQLVGCYVVLFDSVDDNRTPMVNVRHILVNTAEEGQELLDAYMEDPTAETFAALAAEHTLDPGSSATGGLYENIYPGQMVVPFNDWCFDSSRQPGDTGIVQTDYGFHVMYFESACDQTYRDHMLAEELTEELEKVWFDSLVEKTPAQLGDISGIDTGLVLSAN